MMVEMTWDLSPKMSPVSGSATDRHLWRSLTSPLQPNKFTGGSRWSSYLSDTIQRQAPSFVGVSSEWELVTLPTLTT